MGNRVASRITFNREHGQKTGPFRVWLGTQYLGSLIQTFESPLGRWKFSPSHRVELTAANLESITHKLKMLNGEKT